VETSEVLIDLFENIEKAEDYHNKIKKKLEREAG